MASTTAHRDNGKPCRPRSGYNFFFKEQVPGISEMMLRENGKKGTYTQLSATVSKRWKEADRQTRAYYQSLAVKDKRRYGLELVLWRIRQEERGTGIDNEDEDQNKKRKTTKRTKNTKQPEKGVPRKTLDYETQDKQTLQAVPVPIPSTLSAPCNLPDVQSDIYKRDSYEWKLPPAQYDSSKMESFNAFPAFYSQLRSLSAPTSNSDMWTSAAYPALSGPIDRDDAMFLQELFGYETD
uniref:HMG box domain-containing protein n=1 Tax=Amphora coffeiformis TaxID=265554 RepID=A0A7S3P7Z8_9STRA|mmetsp:Transcript_13968/g.26769  ORF Transcript_13968/g.26769 Transcript_13968/m.26769 type:complete len:238 (-) Transcript_13968:58-771(-)